MSFARSFRVCPNCGYERRFHSSFLRSEEDYRIALICPNCVASTMWDGGCEGDAVKLCHDDIASITPKVLTPPSDRMANIYFIIRKRTLANFRS